MKTVNLSLSDFIKTMSYYEMEGFTLMPTKSSIHVKESKTIYPLPEKDINELVTNNQTLLTTNLPVHTEKFVEAINDSVRKYNIKGRNAEKINIEKILEKIRLNMYNIFN